jgi:hypothetical protein
MVKNRKPTLTFDSSDSAAAIGVSCRQFLVASIAVLISGCSGGCSGDREVPASPVTEVLLHPPAEVSEQYAGEWSVTVNGTQISDPISVAQGAELEFELDPTQLVRSLAETHPQYGFLMEVRLLPGGSSDGEWTNREIHEYSAVWVLGMNSSDPPNNLTQTAVTVDCKPGEYDARIYLVGINRYEVNPMIELLGKTTVTVAE